MRNAYQSCKAKSDELNTQSTRSGRQCSQTQKLQLLQLLAEGKLEVLREILKGSLLEREPDLSPDAATPVSHNFSEQLMAPLQGQGQPASANPPRPCFQNYLQE